MEKTLKKIRKEQSQRVSKHRKELIAAGYKHIGFLVSPEEHRLIMDAKKHFDMSAHELFMYFVSGQYKIDQRKDGVSYVDDDDDIWSSSWGSPEERDASMQKLYENGEVFKFEGKKDFVIASVVRDKKKFPSSRVTTETCIKDFDSYQAAMEFGIRKNFPKTHHIILCVKAHPDEQVSSHWYWPKQHIQNVLPGISEYSLLTDPRDFSFKDPGKSSIDQDEESDR